MTERDTRKPHEYWIERVPAVVRFMGRYEDRRDTETQNFKQRLGDGYSASDKAFEVVSALYSSGAPIPEVISAARHLLLDAYPRFVALCREDPDYAIASYGGGWDFRTRYLALAVLCRLTPEESRPLVDAVDFWPERDAVWERFITALGHGAGRETVVGLVWPEAYAPLYEAMDPAGTDLTRLAALKTFDKAWLAQMRSATNPFYSNENNKHNTYVGYWNFEAAAAAAILDIDDTQLEQSPTYPKAWADWARMH